MPVRSSGLALLAVAGTAIGTDLCGAQLKVLPKPNVACLVTLSYSDSESPGNYLAVAATTAEFP